MLTVLFGAYGLAVAMLTDIERPSPTLTARRISYAVAILVAVAAVLLLRPSFWLVFFLGVGVLLGMGFRRWQRGKSSV